MRVASLRTNSIVILPDDRGETRHRSAVSGRELTSQLGYRLLASEFATFPVDPAVDTIENCRQRVADADVFILVIGGRYGSRSQAGQSVTNLEYLMARERGLPIYSFVSKEVLTLLRVWDVNPAADFSHAVDSADLFRFVSQVASADRVWVTPFETAQEIVAGLRAQLAYLMARGLSTLASLRATPDHLEGFSGPALRLILEDAALLRERHRAGVALGTGEHVLEQEMRAWIKARLIEVERSVQQAEILIQHTVNNALTSRNPQALRRAANHVGAIYRECLEWTARVRRADVPEHWRETTVMLATAYDAALDALEALPSSFAAEVQRILASGTSQDVMIKFRFIVDLPQDFHAVFMRALAVGDESPTA